MRLPDRLDWRTLEAAVPGDEWQIQVKCGCSNETIWHIGSDIAGNFVDGFSHTFVYRLNEEPRPRRFSGGFQPLERFQWQTPSLN